MPSFGDPGPRRPLSVERQFASRTPPRLSTFSLISHAYRCGSNEGQRPRATAGDHRCRRSPPPSRRCRPALAAEESAGAPRIGWVRRRRGPQERRLQGTSSAQLGPTFSAARGRGISPSVRSRAPQLLILAAQQPRSYPADQVFSGNSVILFAPSGPNREHE